MRAINRKALRDLWLMRGQALAIALVIAAGIAMLIMSRATLESLRDTRDSLYQESHFSHIWASVKRAPLTVAERLADIPGVADVETRLISSAKLEIPDFAEPAQALVQSLPENGAPRQNGIFIRSGRLPAAGSTNEVLIGETFAKLHQLQVGDSIRATIYGRNQRVVISGIAGSVEHLYLVRPGAMFPDDLHYTILWMPEPALAAALDMQGAFNQATIRLSPGAQEKTVITAVDRLLARYGGYGAYGRLEQLSYRMLYEEFRQLTTLTWMFPGIFLSVAAFLLNMVFKRLISMQRDQVAILKAFGYSTGQVALHYGLIVSLICLLGNLFGVFAGIWLGRQLAGLYQLNFHFPYLYFRLNPHIIVVGVAISLLTAWIGSGYAVYRAAREPVAQAMRPPAPDRFSRTLLERIGLARFLSQPTRMIWRQLERRPGKALFSILALAAAGGIVIIGNFQKGSVSYMLSVEQLTRPYNITATFIESVPNRVLYELNAISGVRASEGLRNVSIRLHHQGRQKLLALTGIPADSRMYQLLNADLKPLSLQEGGLILSDYFAETLDIRVGEKIWVDILDGRGRTLQLPVVQTVYDLSGSNAYMTLATLNRLLGDGPLINAAMLTGEPDTENAIIHELNQRPKIMSGESRLSAIRAFRENINRITGTFSVVTIILGMIVNIGVVYNTMRMALSERGRELASLRVLGFTHGEVAYILLGEMGFLVLFSLPLGGLFGYGLIAALIAGLQNDIYRIPLAIDPAIYAVAALTTLSSAILSALVIIRRIRRLDLIEVLKTRE